MNTTHTITITTPTGAEVVAEITLSVDYTRTEGCKSPGWEHGPDDPAEYRVDEIEMIDLVGPTWDHDDLYNRHPACRWSATDPRKLFPSTWTITGLPTTDELEELCAEDWRERNGTN